MASDSKPAEKPAPITNGAALTKALKASGTGERKLDVCRQVLRDVRDSAGRVATSREVVAALEEHEAVGEVTVDKARTLAGMPRSPRAAAKRHVAIEDQLLGETDAPELDLDAESEEGPDDAEEGSGSTEPVGTEPEVMETVGPAKPKAKLKAKSKAAVKPRPDPVATDPLS